MKKSININGRDIGTGCPTYIVAEMSANHNKSYEQAVRLIEVAKETGADAIKLQTYTPDTITIDCDNEYFRIKGTMWEGKNLHKLYEEAFTPWEWQPKLKEVANSLGIDLFSTPFDHSSVDFLEDMDVPVYKIASFELVDIPLLRKVASKGRPVIMSTGMATLSEIDEAVRALRDEGLGDLALLKCTSAYPAPPEEMNLRTIPHLSEAFGVPVGLSDHTLSSSIAVAAVSLGACVVEKHLTLSRENPGPDNAFSLEPDEFADMVKSIRDAEKAIGTVNYQLSRKEKDSRAFRRSLFAVTEIHEGQEFTAQNIRSIRPGHGLHTRYLDDLIGKKATKNIQKGTPLQWDLVR